MWVEVQGWMRLSLRSGGREAVLLFMMVVVVVMDGRGDTEAMYQA